MAATRHQLHRVGFSPRQSEVLVRLHTDTALPSTEELIRVGFTKDQARVLRTTVPRKAATPSPDGGITPGTAAVPADLPELKTLIREAKLSKAQAQLLLAA